MTLCPRHEDALETALLLRGMLRPSLTSDVDLGPLLRARQLIVTHATNLAGRAAFEMLREKKCPLCFVSVKNPLGLNLDDWVDRAAEEAAHEFVGH